MSAKVVEIPQVVVNINGDALHYLVELLCSTGLN